MKRTGGLLLFFRTDDFDMTLKRARPEFSLRDPDEYYVTISELAVAQAPA